MSVPPSGAGSASSAPSPGTILAAAQAAARDLRFDIALELIRVLVKRGGDLGDRWNEAAQLAMQLEDAVSAVEAQQRFIAAAPGDAHRRVPLIAMLLRASRPEDALTLAEELLKQDEANAYLIAQAAMIRYYLGDSERAHALYRRALDLNPKDHESWRQLAKLLPLEPGGAEVTRMETLAGQLRDAGKVTQASAVEFGLGDAFEKAGDMDRAMTHYARAQDSMCEIRPHPIGEEQAFVDRITEVFSERFYAGLAQAGEGHNSTRPVLVFSLPRSGSTLVESLLASHSQTAGGGELEAMRMACYPFGHYAPGDLERFVRTHGDAPAQGGAFGRIGAQYLKFVSELFGQEGRVVDKALELPFLAGPAVAALPQASYVWLRRDPRDVALSIYKTPFPQRHDWSWSWERIAWRIVHIHALERHFTRLFPERFLTLDYERLAQDPGAGVSCLLDHCELPHESLEQRFHERDSAVMTASHAQVRQPVSTKSIGSWRKYEAHMTPFLEIFERIWPEEWGDPYPRP